MSGKKIMAFGAALLAIAILAWLASNPNEPRYQGKRLSSWLKELEHSTGDTNGPAIIAFREMGPRAIPPLIRVIECGGSSVERLIWKFNQKQSMIEIPVTSSWSREIAASRALSAIGTNARPVLPLLTNWLFHSNHILATGIALAGLGPEGIAPLLVAATNQSLTIRFAGTVGSPGTELEFAL